MNRSILNSDEFLNWKLPERTTNQAMIFLIDIAGFQAHKAVIFAYLSGQERSQREGRAHARQALFSRGILRHVLSHYARIEHSELIFHNGNHGKPFCGDHPNLAFNITHSQNYIAIALALDTENRSLIHSMRPLALGIDIEARFVMRAFDQLATHYFTAAEQAYVSADEAGIHARFYDIWTKKEAIMKASGLGIQLKPSSFCTVTSPVQSLANDHWYTTMIESSTNTSLCLAYNRAEIGQFIQLVQVQ